MKRRVEVSGATGGLSGNRLLVVIADNRSHLLLESPKELTRGLQLRTSLGPKNCYIQGAKSEVLTLVTDVKWSRLYLFACNLPT